MLALVVALALHLDLTAAVPSSAMVVAPGKQLGAFELGMTAGDLAQLGAVTTDGQPPLGALTATLDRRGRVAEIAAHLTFYGQPRLVIEGKIFQLEFLRHTASEMVQRFTGCRKPKFTDGERLYREWRCSGVRVEERLADGDPELTIYVSPHGKGKP